MGEKRKDENIPVEDNNMCVKSSDFIKYIHSIIPDLLWQIAVYNL